MKHNTGKTVTAILLSAILAGCTACGTDSPSSRENTDTSQINAEVLQETADVSQECPERVTIEGNSFYVDGREIWFNGANTPWDNWNDFGGSFDAAFWDRHFTELNDAGVNSTRIWINCNGLVGVKINEDGSFGSVTDKHWEDLDTLFSLAKEHKIYVMATLLSFDHFKNSNTGYQNWRNMITDSDNIDSFVEGYVVPFVKRYDDNDYLYSIDLMNEADWVYENAECGKIPWENISDYFARAAAGIHENSDILVTSGLAMVKYHSDRFQGNKVSDEYLKSLSGNENSYLDFYSMHYYHWEKEWFGYPFDQTPADYGLTDAKPCVIGECAAVDEGGVSLTNRYEQAFQNGWKGVYVWTSNGVDSCGGYDDMAPATKNILTIAQDYVYPAGKE
ncbi:MAG: hypothetical protein ACI4SA_02030 [Lachnospiraceae bacterium]